MNLKKDINKLLYIFLLSHLIIWTLAPALTNVNLPLDTIEALAWSSQLEWGYNKHPPFSAFVVGVVYFVFGTNDWAYYLLSQLFVLTAFFYIWKLSKDFFNDSFFPVLSVLILESIFYFNYTTPEFNVYICQLPLKSIAVYYFWKSVTKNNVTDWLLTGLFCSLGVLTHYSFLFLLLSMLVFFLFFLKKDNQVFKNFFLSMSLFLILCLPHIFWLFKNDFLTINYAFARTDVVNKEWFDHFINPLIFFSKQIGMMLFFFLTFFSIFSFSRKSLFFKKINKKEAFLICIGLLPLVLVFLTALITGAKIRTMWMSTFYLFSGLLIFYFFQKGVKIKKINNFIYIITFIFLASPSAYIYISLSNEFKRTDYPGKEIARLVQNKWDQNFVNEIKLVIGDEWSAGNLSYHLPSRPIWINELKNYVPKIKENQGVIYTGNPKILKQICPGVFGTIQPVGYCMIGKK